MPWRESSEGSISHNGIVIPYKLRRSKRRRKTFQISVNDAGVRVAVPYRTPNREVRAFLNNHAPWILKQLAKLEDLPEPKNFVTGETLPYLGRDLHLTVGMRPVTEARVRLRQGSFYVEAPQALKGDDLREEIKRAFLHWYQQRAEQRIAAAVNLRWPSMKQGKKPQIIIGNQKTLWGSCAADGSLRFNWRLVMMPLPLMEYVVVHELAHLKERNHSPAFWKVVATAMPDALQRRRQLRETGRTLPL